MPDHSVFQRATSSPSSSPKGAQPEGEPELTEEQLAEKEKKRARRLRREAREAVAWNSLVARLSVGWEASPANIDEGAPAGTPHTWGKQLRTSSKAPSAKSARGYSPRPRGTPLSPQSPRHVERMNEWSSERDEKVQNRRIELWLKQQEELARVQAATIHKEKITEEKEMQLTERLYTGHYMAPRRGPEARRKKKETLDMCAAPVPCSAPPAQS